MSVTTQDRNTVTHHNGHAAATVARETKAAVDSLLDMESKASENGRALLQGNQELLKRNIAFWHEFNQLYANLVVEATQGTVERMLAVRAALAKSTAANVKQAEALNKEERQIALDVAELYQAQAKAAADYSTRMLTTTAQMLETSAKMTAWAAEHTGKMFSTK